MSPGGGGYDIQPQILAIFLSPVEGLDWVWKIAPVSVGEPRYNCDFCTKMFCVFFFSCSLSHSPLLLYSPLLKSLSKWLIFLEMLTCFFRDVDPLLGLALLDYCKALSCLDPRLSSIISMLFSSLLPHRLCPRPSSPHFSLSLIVFLLFCLFFSMLRWCQVLCDNWRLMGIKRIWETWENTTIPLNISTLLWGRVKEQEVTREKKKGSGADCWIESVLFLGCWWGPKHQIAWQHCDLQSLSLLCSHVFSLERWYISAGFRHEAVVALKFGSYHLWLTTHHILCSLSLYLNDFFFFINFTARTTFKVQYVEFSGI